MTTSAETRRQIKSAVEDFKIGISELSAASGVNRSTIYRVLSDDYEFTPSARTIDRLLAAIVELREADVVSMVRAYRTIDDEITPPQQETLPVLYEVGTDQWNEPTDADPAQPFTARSETFQPYSGGSHIAVNPRFRRDQQHLVVARGPSANKIFHDGDLIHVISSTILQTIMLQVGDFVVVVKKSTSSGGFQLRIYEIVAAEGRHIYLEAPTLDQNYVHNIKINVDENMVRYGIHEYYIVAVVIGFYRQLHYLSG